MGRAVSIEPLTREAYAPFGQVIEVEGAHHYPINGGMTERYHDLAKVELGGVHPRPLVSIARGQPYSLPLTLKMVERHPLGSQAFVPLSGRPYLVVVAPAGPAPGVADLRLFVARGDQGVNYGRGVWHHPLLALDTISDFLVIDRSCSAPNCDEVTLDLPGLISQPV